MLILHYFFHEMYPKYTGMLLTKDFVSWFLFFILINNNKIQQKKFDILNNKILEEF